MQVFPCKSACGASSPPSTDPTGSAMTTSLCKLDSSFSVTKRGKEQELRGSEDDSSDLSSSSSSFGSSSMTTIASFTTAVGISAKSSQHSSCTPSLTKLAKPPTYLETAASSFIRPFLLVKHSSAVLVRAPKRFSGKQSGKIVSGSNRSSDQNGDLHFDEERKSNQIIDTVVIATGGALCFSFGTHFNRSVRSCVLDFLLINSDFLRLHRVFLCFCFIV